MERPDAPRRPLAIDADLDVSIDGHAMKIAGHGRHLVIDVASVRTAWRLFRDRSFASQVTNGMLPVLNAAGIVVDVRVAGRSVGRAGPGVQTNRMGRWLRLPGVEVRTLRFIRSMFGR